MNDALLVAVHEHPAEVVTDDDPAVTPGPIDWEFGEIENAHPVAWFTVNVWPAMVRVPVRATPGLAAELKLTGPFPAPAAPDVTVIQGALLVAVQAHPAAVVTDVEPVPPPAPIDCDVGEMENEHGGALKAFCETVKVWPAIVSVPLRAAPVFAATEKLTVPLPFPDAPEVTVIQLSALTAVHAQPVSAVTETDRVPPPATTVVDVDPSWKVHGTPSWRICIVTPLTVMSPWRDVNEVFAAAWNPIVPFPCPDAGAS